MGGRAPVAGHVLKDALDESPVKNPFSKILDNVASVKTFFLDNFMH